MHLESGFDMIDSYKNIERLRYRINKDLLAICADIKKGSEEQRIMYIDECFSAVASSIAALLFSQSTFEPLKDFLYFTYEFYFDRKPTALAISFITSVMCMAVLIYGSFCLNRLLIKWRRRKNNCGPEGIDTTDYVKEFDNIACDSVFVAIEYKDLYLSTKNIGEKTLYYLEAMHYLKTAGLITERLCANIKNIKSPKNVLGVDNYRIRNMKTVMSGLQSFMNQELNNLALDRNDKNDVQKNLKEIKESIDRVNT